MRSANLIPKDIRIAGMPRGSSVREFRAPAPVTQHDRLQRRCAAARVADGDLQVDDAQQIYR